MVLDNPLWASLTTLHRSLAVGAGAALRYPADVAPFLATGGEATAADVAALVAPGETIYCVGPRPPVPVTDLGTIVQMLCATPPTIPDGPAIVELGASHHAAVLALAALVYPHYFRPRTTALGRYFGVFEGDRLAAMIGERMGMPGYREISAVCTHPDHTGRGLARRLLATLTADIAAGGATPFLHVSPDNARAIALYEQNGYRARIAIPFARVS